MAVPGGQWPKEASTPNDVSVSGLNVGSVDVMPKWFLGHDPIAVSGGNANGVAHIDPGWDWDMIAAGGGVRS